MGEFIPAMKAETALLGKAAFGAKRGL